MTEAGIILPMKTARGVVKDGKVQLLHPLPDGEIVYVRLLTEEEQKEDEDVMAELMEEMKPWHEASRRSFARFVEEHLAPEPPWE